MIGHKLLLILALLCLPVSLSAQSYEVEEFPGPLYDYRMAEIGVVTAAELVFGDLPKHPKIIWLGGSNIRIGHLQNRNTLSFVVTSPGLLQIPPIPVILESKEFFIRFDDIEVLPNPVPKDFGKLEVLWNLKGSPPEEIHVGEAVEIEYLLKIPMDEQARQRTYFETPSSRIGSGRWHQFVETAGRRAYPQDFFLRYRVRDLMGVRNRIYQQVNRRIDGQPYTIRSYVARAYFNESGTATGHLSATIGRHPNYSRTHVLPFSIKVAPLPPLPNDQAINTGLVGEWQFGFQVTPRKPEVSKPLEILVAVQGSGNPKLRNNIDFSGEGFPSIESKWQEEPDPNKQYVANFHQSLLPTGKVGTLPARSIAHFDTVDNEWKIQEVIPLITLPGFKNTHDTLAPRSDLGDLVTRPVLLNLPLPTFGVIALAPFLPFFFAFARRKLDARDPEKDQNEKELKNLVSLFRSDSNSEESIDTRLLPLLRKKYQLPTGATTREVATKLADDDKKLAELLRHHAESSFSGNKKPLDLKLLADRISKLSFIGLLILSLATSARGATLAEANQAFADQYFTKAAKQYQELIAKNPGSASLYFNLAQAHLAADEPTKAQAACHTALLLEPLDPEIRQLMSAIRAQQSDTTVGRSAILSLRPDQWILLAASLWFLGFLYLGIRKLRPFPLWPGLVLLGLSALPLAVASWRQNTTYASSQYMILAEELPREPTPGNPDWKLPTLTAGDIVHLSEKTKTHGLVTSSETSFWLPLPQLQKVW